MVFIPLPRKTVSSGVALQGLAPPKSGKANHIAAARLYKPPSSPRLTKSWNPIYCKSRCADVVCQIDRTAPRRRLAISSPCVSPLHELESVSQEPGMGALLRLSLPRQFKSMLSWRKPIHGRLEHVDTGGCVDFLRLVILPLEDGHDSLWRASHKSPAIATLGGGTNSIPDCPKQLGESHSNRNTPAPPGTISPSSLPLSTDAAVGLRESQLGGWCCRKMIAAAQADAVPHGCPSGLQGRLWKFVLQRLTGLGDASSHCSRTRTARDLLDIDVPEDCDYDSAEDCRLVACWLGLAESMMKEREDTLCCGNSMPPVGNTDGINLGVEEQVFREPKPQNTGLVGKKRRRTQRTLQLRKQLQWSN